MAEAREDSDTAPTPSMTRAQWHAHQSRRHHQRYARPLGAAASAPSDFDRRRRRRRTGRGRRASATARCRTPSATSRPPAGAAPTPSRRPAAGTAPKSSSAPPAAAPALPAPLPRSGDRFGRAGAGGVRGRAGPASCCDTRDLSVLPPLLWALAAFRAGLPPFHDYIVRCSDLALRVCAWRRDCDKGEELRSHARSRHSSESVSTLILRGRIHSKSHVVWVDARVHVGK